MMGFIWLSVYLVAFRLVFVFGLYNLFPLAFQQLLVAGCLSIDLWGIFGPHQDEWQLRDRCGSAALRGAEDDGGSAEWAKLHEERIKEPGRFGRDGFFGCGRVF